MQFLNPIKIVLLSFFIWLIFYISIPTTYLYKGSAFFPITILVLYVIFLFLGFSSVRRNDKRFNIEKTSDNKIKQIVYFLFTIGFIGVLIKLFIGFFITKIFISSNIFEKRLELMEGELNSGIYGVISAILFPFAYVSMLIVINNFKLFKRKFLIFAILIGLFPIIETYFIGGRTIIVLLGTTIINTALFTIQKYYNFKTIVIKLYNYKLFSIPSFLLKKKYLLVLIILLIGFKLYSVKVVSERLNKFNYRDTLGHWEYLQEVKIDPAYKKFVNSKKKQDKYYEISLYSLKHYFVHGKFEYIRLVNHLDKKSGYYYGGYEFYPFLKIFKAVGVPIKSFYEMNEIVYKKSVFTTFWGPFYIDFGVFGILIMFFWGRFIKKSYYFAIKNYTPYTIFYGYISTILLASFFINLLLGSSAYYLFSFLITILIFKFWPKNVKFVLK